MRTREKQLESAVTLLVSLLAFVGITAIACLLFLNGRIEDLESRPTYYCDGSETMGFADPGTPEAAACWYELKK